MARRSRGSYPVRTSHRQTGWELGPGSEAGTPLSLSASSSGIIGSGVAPVVDGLTIVRTRGEMLFYLDSATADNDGFLVAVGIGIVTADAFAIGATAVPSPLSDADWDGWLFYDFRHVFAEVAAIDTADRGWTARLVIDSKAMRRIGVNDVVFMTAEGAETGTSVVRCYGISRMLFKLA